MRFRISAVFGKHYSLYDLPPRLPFSVSGLSSFGPCRSIVIVTATDFCALLAFKETESWTIRVALGNVVALVVLRDRLRFSACSASSQVLVRRCRGIVNGFQSSILANNCVFAKMVRYRMYSPLGFRRVHGIFTGQLLDRDASVYVRLICFAKHRLFSRIRAASRVIFDMVNNVFVANFVLLPPPGGSSARRVYLATVA